MKITTRYDFFKVQEVKKAENNLNGNNLNYNEKENKKDIKEDKNNISPEIMIKILSNAIQKTLLSETLKIRNNYFSMNEIVNFKNNVKYVN